jgi:rhodanese-related sulfurtransferase
VDLAMPRPVEPAELRRRIEAGEWVVDLRERTAFAAGHLAGSLGFELSRSFVTYLGWLHRYGTPLTLIGETPEQIAAARRELVRIGVDDLAGAATGPVDAMAGGAALRSYPVSDFAGLAKAREQGPVHVLDVRRDDERAAGCVAGSQHIPLHELGDRIDEVPAQELWVHCGTGYRASVAASVLDRLGCRVVLIDDSYEAASAAGLEAASSGSGAGGSG